MMKRDSFIFYSSFYDAISEFDSVIQNQIYEAIMQYSIYGNEVVLNGIPKAIFALIKPQLDANLKRYENGKKGGRPSTKTNKNKTKTKPKQNQNQTKDKPNDNYNDNSNYNGNYNENYNHNENDESVCLSLFEENLIRQQRDENKLRQTMTNQLSKRLFDTIFDCWDQNRRGSRFDALTAFNTYLNVNDKQSLYDFEYAFNFYVASDEVQRGVIMRLDRFCKEWKGWFEQAKVKKYTMKGEGCIEMYDEERQTTAI